MARKSVLWNIWKPYTDRFGHAGQLNVGRVHAWSDTAPDTVIGLWIANRQRLCSRPLGLNADDYGACHYPINAMDDYGD